MPTAQHPAAQEPVESSLRASCISDIIRDVLDLNKNGPELCNYIILYVLVILLHISFMNILICYIYFSVL